jgi:hypothetical protein
MFCELMSHYSQTRISHLLCKVDRFATSWALWATAKRVSDSATIEARSVAPREHIARVGWSQRGAWTKPSTHIRSSGCLLTDRSGRSEWRARERYRCGLRFCKPGSR